MGMGPTLTHFYFILYFAFQKNVEIYSDVGIFIMQKEYGSIVSSW